MSETLREAAIRAVWALEDREIEPSVEQYVDAVLAVIRDDKCIDRRNDVVQ